MSSDTPAPPKPLSGSVTRMMIANRLSHVKPLRGGQTCGSRGHERACNLPLLLQRTVNGMAERARVASPYPSARGQRDNQSQKGARQESLPSVRAGRGRDNRSGRAYEGPRRLPSRPKQARRNRTCNPRFWRPVLYQLSYGPRNGSGLKLANPRQRGQAPRPAPLVQPREPNHDVEQDDDQEG